MSVNWAITKTIKDAKNGIQILYSYDDFPRFLILINASFNIFVTVVKTINEIGIPKLKASSIIKL